MTAAQTKTITVNSVLLDHVLCQLTPGRRMGTKPIGYSTTEDETIYVNAPSVAAACCAVTRANAAIKTHARNIGANVEWTVKTMGVRVKGHGRIDVDLSERYA